MPNGIDREQLEAILESLESEAEPEQDGEAAGSRSRGRSGYRGQTGPRTAPSAGSYRAPTQNTYVTQKELQENIQRVDAKIATNSDAIKAVNARVGTLDTDMSRLATALKKETEERKKQVSTLGNNVQLSALLPLLTPQKTKEIKADDTNTGLSKGDKVLVDGSSSLTALLPLILLGGMGTSSDASSSGSAGGMNDPMMMVVLALALTQSSSK